MKKKYTKNNEKSFGFLLLFCFFPLFSFGQDLITQIPQLYSINSVIREVSPGITLTYDAPPGFSSQNKRFIYSAGTGTTLVADIPNQYVINDMEIDNDYVYFCGRKEGTTNQGMFGYFKISDVFFNNGSINYCIIPTPISSNYYSNGQDAIQNLTRIELLKMSDGIHLFLAGKAQFQCVLHPYKPVWCLIDAHCNASGIWQMNYTMDYDCNIAYDDVAVIDNNVIATVHSPRRNSSTQFTHGYLYYPLPANANANIFDPYEVSPGSPMANIPGFYTDMQNCDYDTSVRVLIEHMGGPFFNTVLASFLTDCGSFAMLSSYKGVGVPIYKAMVKLPDLNPFREIKGKIDATNGMLYMIEYPFSTRFLQVHLSPNLPIPGTSFLQKASNIYHWQSFDISGVLTQAVISGAIQDHEKMFWRYDCLSNNSCRTIQNILLNEVNYSDIPFVLPQYKNEMLLSHWEVVATNIHGMQKIIICNQ